MTDMFANIRARAKAEYAELEKRADKILAKGMMDMAANARRRSVDKEIAASIHTVGPITDKRGRRTVLVIAGDESTIDTGDDGKRYQRARQQEFGTRFLPARPYMRPAYRDVAPKVRSSLAAMNRRFLKRLFKQENGQ